MGEILSGVDSIRSVSSAGGGGGGVGDFKGGGEGESSLGVGSF